MKFRKLIFVLVFVPILYGTNEISAQNAAQKMDALFNSSQIPAYFNGNVLVAESGKIVYQKSFGYADFSINAPNVSNSTFQTASISKIFTSTAILQLRDKGKLKLTDFAVKYLPDFHFPNITIKHLLSHTSGLPDLELYEPVIRTNPELKITNKETIPALKSWGKPLKFQPGEKWNYCNTNYVILVLIVEKISNQPFHEYAGQFIFEPAKMKNTYVRPAISPTADKMPVKNHILPVMYQTTPQDVETVKLNDAVKMRRIKYEHYNLGYTQGDQNVVSTTEDLLKFDQILYSEKLLKASTLDEAMTPTKLNNGETYVDDFGVHFGKKCSYGLGWIICDIQNIGKIAGHDGANRGISTVFYRNLTKKQTVIMFDNTEGRGFNRKVASVINILNSEKPLEINLKISIAREFGETLLNSGIEAAIIKFNELRKDAEHYQIDEEEINLLGYDFLFNNYKTASLEAFKLNVLLFPDSFNAYDSYGEALAENGRKAEAILMYKKALLLNPNSEGTKKALKSLEGK